MNKDSTVKVFLRGGLGNQLFQYGAALALALKNNSNVVVDCTLLPSAYEQVNGLSRWQEQISEFNSDAFITGINSGKPRHLAISKFLQSERLWGERFRGSSFIGSSYAGETIENVDLFRSLDNKKIRINAYCGSPKFFLGFDNEIKSRIRSLKNPSQSYLDALLVMKNKKVLALHVRLGDYKNLPAIYGSFDKGYFLEALKVMQKIVEYDEIWIFSDEPQLAKTLLPSLAKVDRSPSFINNLSGLETVLVMSRAQGLIASNSSFSWWGAFLNNKQNFKCIFPYPFFGEMGPKEPKSLLLPGWLQLVRNFDV